LADSNWQIEEPGPKVKNLTLINADFDGSTLINAKILAQIVQLSEHFDFGAF